MKTNKTGKYGSVEFRGVFAIGRPSISLQYINEWNIRGKKFLSGETINPKRELRMIWKESGRDHMWCNYREEY